MMVSQERILAARANGARSRRPKTGQDKSRSSRNATRHAPLSKCVVLGNESRESFQALFDLRLARAFHNLLLLQNSSMRNEPNNSCVSSEGAQPEPPGLPAAEPGKPGDGAPPHDKVHGQ